MFLPKAAYIALSVLAFTGNRTQDLAVASYRKDIFPSNNKDRYSPIHTHSLPTNMCLVMRHIRCYILLHVEFDHIFWEGCKDDIILK